MAHRSIALVGLVAVVIGGCLTGRRPTEPLPVVPSVDLAKYAGTWYEIARFPHGFQEGCVGSKAVYTLRGDGKVDVVNQCFEGSLDGKLRQAKATARVADPATNAKLKVTFFWPFSGDYWVIDLGKDYEYAVVGHPSREYLWILSRTTTMDPARYESIVERLGTLGYDISRLIRTPQP